MKKKQQGKRIRGYYELIPGDDERRIDDITIGLFIPDLSLDDSPKDRDWYWPDIKLGFLNSLEGPTPFLSSFDMSLPWMTWPAACNLLEWFYFTEGHDEPETFPDYLRLLEANGWVEMPANLQAEGD